MSLRTYKTNHLLWAAVSLIVFLLFFYGSEYVFALFSGHLKLADLLSLEFIIPLFISVVVGWLFQCAVVIIMSRKREDSKAKQ